MPAPSTINRPSGPTLALERTCALPRTTPAPSSSGGPSQGPEFFAKGLFVSGGVAYFGLSRVTRQNTTEAARFARNNASCELLALELRTRRLLWRRQLPFRGLVNAIEAPWL